VNARNIRDGLMMAYVVVAVVLWFLL